MSEVVSKTVVGGGFGKIRDPDTEETITMLRPLRCSAMSLELSPTVKLVAEPATLPNLENEQKHGIMKDQVEDDALKVGGYEVQQLEPLKIKERVIPDGNPGPLRNSILLDKSFQTNIETIVGEAQHNGIKKKIRGKRMKKFDYGIQRILSEKNSQTYSVDLQGREGDNGSNDGNHTASATM
ncbi:MAG: hypothetical protein Q9192_005466 [Flavoplaca navasiana]